MERLKERSDFLAAARGTKVATAAFVVQTVARGDAGPVRIGFTVSRKVGNAVERNRVKRRLKDVVRRSVSGRLQAGHDYVVIGRRPALTESFGHMVEQFDMALGRLHRARAGARLAKTSVEDDTGH